MYWKLSNYSDTSRISRYTTNDDSSHGSLGRAGRFSTTYVAHLSWLPTKSHQESKLKVLEACFWL